MRNFDEAKIIAKSKKYDTCVLEKRCGEYEVRGMHEIKGEPKNIVFIHRYTPGEAVLRDTKQQKPKSSNKNKKKPVQKKSKPTSTNSDLGADS